VEKNDITSVSLYDLLSNFITAEELEKIDFLDLSPEFILKCFRKTPGILQAAYLGGGNFEIESATAGKFEIKIAVKEEKVMH